MRMLGIVGIRSATPMRAAALCAAPIQAASIRAAPHRRAARAGKACATFP
jgi:hypothetical protein